MNYGTQTERNRSGLRITEISKSERFKKLRCPYCKGALDVWMSRHGICHDVTTQCKSCKRILQIDASGRVSEQPT
ncbi:MAG: hypothetical protein FWH03_00905 [Firmicutes bacterium]|nr:hypothetical protein [Bacillota bacterium]